MLLTAFVNWVSIWGWVRRPVARGSGGGLKDQSNVVVSMQPVTYPGFMYWIVKEGTRLRFWGKKLEPGGVMELRDGLHHSTCVSQTHTQPFLPQLGPYTLLQNVNWADCFFHILLWEKLWKYRKQRLFQQVRVELSAEEMNCTLTLYYCFTKFKWLVIEKMKYFPKVGKKYIGEYVRFWVEKKYPKFSRNGSGVLKSHVETNKVDWKGA